MSTAEQRVQDAFIRAIPPNWFYQRIESTTGRGIPDMFVCREGVSFWLEFKAGEKRLRKEQWAWHMLLDKAHGTTFVIIQRDGVWYLMQAAWKDEATGTHNKLRYEVAKGTLSDIITYLSEL